ncbi:MAG: hypothetical protein GY833_02600 [Aestuariibacter sp.]|nr:hypothetical protein [Aestuariibacter sp.]
MNHNPKISYLDIGHIGSLAIRVPITTIGEGNPHLAVLCSVHGNETTSLVISRYFVQKLMKQDTLHGSVSIITAANPLAQVTRTRVAFSDFCDLNRTGQGKTDGVLTERLAFKLCEFLSTCSFIIDIHDFGMNTPTMAIYIPGNEINVDHQNLEGIAAFGPSTVWALKPTTTEEAEYSGALLSVLITRGIPGFAIETSRGTALSQKDTWKAVEGLIKVTKLVGIIDGKPEMSLPPAFDRNEKCADQAGVWIPTVALMSRVRENEKIGEITSFSLVEHFDVLSPQDGTVIQLRSNARVDTGTNLFTIGTENVEVSKKFQALIGTESESKGS